MKEKSLLSVFMLACMLLCAKALHAQEPYAVLSIATGIVGIVLFERLLMRWKPFARFVGKYTDSIS